MVTGDNGSTALAICLQCKMVTPKMLLHRVVDDVDELKNELTKINALAK